MKGKKLRYPFDIYHGYKQYHPDGRCRMFMWNKSTGQKKSMSLARYRMSVMLGRILSSSEEVDHKDDDFTNDSPTNLQILTPKANRRKEHLRRRGFLQGETPQFCAVCNTKFFHVKERQTCGDLDCKRILLADGRCVA